ncbi:MAG: hypothetical protein KDJ52_19385 [Anaerolineae bacterium]|nr:hypothetical protein [Anaerolineae bacterium]
MFKTIRLFTGLALVLLYLAGRLSRSNYLSKLSIMVGLIALALLVINLHPGRVAADGPTDIRRGNPASAPDIQLQSGPSAPDYCPSQGGNTDWERIDYVDLVKNPSGTMRLTAQVFIDNPTSCTPGEECPDYDPYPEHVKAWIDWNGDKEWDDSELVMSERLTGYLNINYYGTMTAITQFTPPISATNGDTWLRANLGWGDDPGACQKEWHFGNVVDKPLHVSKLKIKKITATGLDTTGKKPEMGSPIRLEADIDKPASYSIVSCNWTGDLIPGEVYNSNKCRYEYTPPIGPGPDLETYGQKDVTLTVNYSDNSTGAFGNVSQDFRYKVFFKQKGDDDNDGIPNWFEYWKDDGAVPGMDASDVFYDATCPAGSACYGRWQKFDGPLYLNSGAVSAFPRHVPAASNCPGLDMNPEGIDTAAHVILHERRHEAIYRNWEPGGLWYSGVADPDGDKMPNPYETGTLGTDPTLPDSCDMAYFVGHAGYQTYGDQEVDATLAGLGAKGIATKDWGNPGKQVETEPGAQDYETVPVASTGGSSSGPAGAIAPMSDVNHLITIAAVPQAELNGTYSSSVQDTDGDGQYNSLNLSAGVTVNEAGSYILVAWLKNGGGTEIAWASTGQSLTVGTHTVSLPFDGQIIRAKGLNGPYTISRIELRAGPEQDVIAAADNVHTSAAYQAVQFEQPAVAFNGTFSDSGQKSSSGASYFNRLRVTVGLNVQTAGTYTITGQLDGSGPIATASTVYNLTPGNNQTINLDFAGWPFFLHRQNGPYHLKYLRLQNAAGQQVDFLADAHTTGPYSYDQFQITSTAIDLGSFSEQVLDADNDGDDEYLRITFNAKLHLSGTYVVQALLKDSSGATISRLEQTRYLFKGNAVPFTLDFPGGDISEHGTNGPYRIAELALTRDGVLMDHLSLAHTTQAYSAADFTTHLVRLTNSYHDYGTDGNNDGLYEALNIDIGLTLGDAGVIFASGRLLDNAGHEVGWANSSKKLTGNGNQTITLSFSASQILANGGDGPFTLTDLLVYHTGDPTQGKGLEQAHITTAYSHLQFGGTSGGGSFRVYLPVIYR